LIVLVIGLGRKKGEKREILNSGEAGRRDLSTVSQGEKRRLQRCLTSMKQAAFGMGNNLVGSRLREGAQLQVNTRDSRQNHYRQEKNTWPSRDGEEGRVESIPAAVLYGWGG